jgi:transcription antitermination factor NusG
MLGKGYDVFLPTVRRETDSETRRSPAPLFPGYVIAKFDGHNRLPILTIPGLLHVVSSGRTPLPIPESEVDSLRIAANSNLNIEPWPFIGFGQQVTVRKGPLAGARGIVVDAKDGQRLAVSISILQRSVTVELYSSWLEADTTLVARAGSI